MIDVKELRIGNWVKVRKGFVQVESIYDQGINLSIESGWYGEIHESYDGYFENNWYKDAVIEPIPLTDELLLKLKCEHRDSNLLSVKEYRFDIEDDGWRLIFSKNKRDGVWMVMLYANGGYDESGEINLTERMKYLHQLQNLIHCLTGKDLIVEL